MPSFLATHPDPGARVQRIRELTGSAPRRAGPADSRYMNNIENLVVGEDPRQGFVEGDVFYHPELRFRFPVPRGFKVVNQPTQVVMVEGQNRALLGFTSTGEKSAEGAAQKFLSQQGLRLVDRGPTRSGGLPAYAAVADAQMKNGQIVRLMVYFVEYRGTVYHFVGYTAQQAFASYRGVFLQTMQGFSEVQDARILNRQPIRLALQSVSRPAPLQELIPRNIPAPLTPQDVAIMNQVDLKQEVSTGRILKVPSAR
jgi:predicted Zn-dependent protease